MSRCLQGNPAPDAPLAVIDIGSNSGRVVVLRRDGDGHLEVLEDVRAPLRLVRALDDTGRFSPDTVTRTLTALRDFHAVALGAGATRIIAVATAAVREAANGDDLIARIHREVGLTVEIIDGQEEGRYAFVGAVYGMAVDHGLLMDLGGGSMQIVHFRDRRILQTWTLPLGALRLSGHFLTSDPPQRSELRRLVGHAQEFLAAAGVPALAPDEHLVGTGGTLRTLAKIDRRAHKYPISRLHGYVLTLRRLDDVVAAVAARPAAERAQVPGLNRDRVDSIVGGALVTQTVLEWTGAKEVQVSGQGLRDGVALHALGADPERLPPAETVRAAAIAALAARFASWHADAAARRAVVALCLLEALDPDAGPEVQELVRHAATVLDIGRSIDYYNRHEHTADILAATDVEGFSHRALALLCAVVRRAGDDRSSLKAYRPLVEAGDEPFLARTAALLALADELARRCPSEQVTAIRCARQGPTVILTAPFLGAGRAALLAERFRGVLGDLLLVGAG